VKVLETNFHRGWGGQPARILMAATGLQARGHRVTLAVPPGSLLGQRARAAGLATFEECHFRHPRHVTRALADRRALRRHLRTHHYDVVSAHGSQDLWTSVASLRGPIRGSRRPGDPRLVFTRHNSKAVATHALNRWLYRRVDRLIVVSRSVLERYESFFRRGDLDPVRVSVIHSAYRADLFHPGLDVARARTDLGLDPTNPVIGVVGRLVADKGQDDLLRAVAMLLPRYPDARTLLVGTGKAETELRRLASSLGLDGKVRFLGFRDDVPRITAALTVSVLPSVDCDASSAALKEALACGVPVVATDIGGASEIVREGETGFVVPPHAPDRLAAAIDALLSDPARAAAMGRRGAADVRARFAPDRLADETIAAYEQAIAEGARGA
jgi:glycosyltransferase involved in cell wall biosynthesis